MTSYTSDCTSGSKISNTSRGPQDDLLRKEPQSIGHDKTDRWSGPSEKVRLEMDTNRLNFTGQNSDRGLTVTGSTNEKQCEKQVNQEGAMVATPIASKETLMQERETGNESVGVQQDFTATQREIPPHIVTNEIPNIDTESHSNTEKGNPSVSYIIIYDG